MRGGDGILGVRSSARSPEANSPKIRTQFLGRREKWLVILGVALHAIYMLSIFDIYFKTPIVHGMEPVTPRFSAPAKRLVLLVADGLRADKFFEPDSNGSYRAPFLRSVIKERGRWGVSHARPPTESRPGHVSIIAGFYEDPSAVTKGWKANPVEFDSVFNRSRHTFAFGSPDIIPIFCGALEHSTWNSYPHEYEDFATDASFLDEWSLDQFEGLLNRSKEDVKLKQLLQQDNLVVFLHLLGCDSNGHAHRPYSTIYLNNVRVVDQIAERVYNLVQNYFKDNSTAFVFTADHGMSDKGSHGDGHPSNTDTPLVAWGAGVRPPVRTFENHHHENTVRFVDDHVHDMPTPADWGLNGFERQDVNQADIAPLMSTLVGLPCPVNSVGNLPLGFVNLSKVDEVEAVLANTKQILNQFLRKLQLKQSNLLRFKPFKPLNDYSFVLDQIEHLISISDYEAAKMLSENLRSLALEGLHYFQTYDWFQLMTVISLGYLGWMVYLMVHVLQEYTSLPRKFFQNDQSVYLQTNTKKIYFLGCLLMGLVCVILLVEHSPPLYHAYFAMTIFLWVRIFREYRFLRALWSYMLGKEIRYFAKLLAKLLASFIVSVFVLEILVKSFMDRKIYTWIFLIIGVFASVYLQYSMPWGSGLPVFVWLACWFLSIFTLMPAEIPDNTKLVVSSGFMIVIIGVASRYLDMYSRESKFWLSLTHEVQKSKSNIIFLFQVLLVAFSAVMVPLSTYRRTEKQELLVLHQVINWSIAGISIVLPLFSPTGLLSRLTSIFLGFAPAFLLLSIGYEAVFYGALALALMAWILFENAYLHISQTSKSSSSTSAMEDDLILESNERCLRLSDMRIPLAFMVFFNIAFFGTGNFASIASFEISSVYRFITIFNPFLMAALLIFKLLIPFMLVVCTFTAITKMVKVPLLGCYFLVIICSDIMTVHFFFLVRNTGSWMEIGNSISHFGIMSAQVVFVLLLFAVTTLYTKHIQIRSSKRHSRKHM
ncbi:GPI ethanolamine phosphate transferase 1-like isoform X2 [Salvia splendens]|uniref:GPI ethanolamine phosphate transferase 1-like isoform X2 n=1 Tax=Salvia splendens TaxID=180675 RepID=UPI001C26154C|nr:GPI ethanolamine phosphate transferase 1-like isoform X2 [Salvia splendens]